MRTLEIVEQSKYGGVMTIRAILGAEKLCFSCYVDQAKSIIADLELVVIGRLDLDELPITLI